MTTELFGLSTEAELLSALGKGEALWLVGGRSFRVQHLTSDIEWPLVQTDRAMLEAEATVLDRQAQRSPKTPSTRTISSPGGSHEPPGTRHHGRWERWRGIVIVALLGLLAGGTGVVWLAGNIASLLAGSGTLAIDASEAASVAWRLPDVIGDPALVWPASVRDQLPGTTTIVVAMIVAFILVFAAIAAVVLVLTRVPQMRRPENSAQWATGRDLRELHVRGAQRGRLVLGRHREQLLAAEPRASAAAGPLHRVGRRGRRGGVRARDTDRAGDRLAAFVVPG